MLRPTDRIELLERIGVELQQRYTFKDIEVFFGGYDIQCRDRVPSFNSKRVFVKEVLADESDELALQIADDLGLEVPHVVPARQKRRDSSYWEEGGFRLFISHVSAFKLQAAHLKAFLTAYAITGFVAHDDIAPTREWEDEILKALESMDALAAILTPGFHESSWTDQEVGFAHGRGVVVVAIRRGLDPYGFIGRYQGIQGKGKRVSDVASQVFEALVSNVRTREAMVEAVVAYLLRNVDVRPAFRRTGEADSLGHWLALLEGIESIPSGTLERLRNSTASAPHIVDSAAHLARLNRLFKKHGVAAYSAPARGQGFGDDIPF